MTAATDCSIAAIERTLEKIEAYVAAKAARSAATDLGRTSEFWQGTFAERPNFPSITDFLVFRRAGYGYGMADERQGSLEREKQHADRTFEIFRQSLDLNRAAAIDESALGAPFVFLHNRIHRSAGFWTNAATSLRVQDILGARGMAQNPLRVLEIGAGWGCMAHQLHQLLEIESYTIVDLPENLTLSSAYLSSTLRRSLRLGAGDGAGDLVCLLPGDAPALAGKYDVIVNSFSLQEMELATVRGYFGWIAAVLAPDGVFISFNSHGKSGVAAPSDYPLGEFRLESLSMFRAYPSGLLNTIPYEMVLSHKRDSAAAVPVLLDTFGCLFQLGLGDDLKPFCEQFVRHALTPETENALRQLRGYFSPAAESRKAALGSGISSVLPSVHAYLSGLDALARGDAPAARRLFESALGSGLRGFARLRASASLALLSGQKTLPQWATDFDARMAYPELARMLDEQDVAPFIAQFERILSVDLPRRDI